MGLKQLGKTAVANAFVCNVDQGFHLAVFHTKRHK